MSNTRDTDTNNQEYTTPVIEIDAYAPAKMADRVGRVGVAKSQLSALTLFALSILASGFENCVANMYFIPMSVVLRKNPAVVAAAEKMAGKTLDLSQLTWKGFFINNLVPVTLGNIVGGVILVGIMFWFVYLRPHISDAYRLV